VRYKARDGLSIPGYLTMPRHPDGTKPPLIVDIHGGPFVEAEGWGYSPDAQLFASRGYAVLQPDFRGTHGYGDAFFKAGFRQWGLAMQDDVTDGVQWLIDTGKVDPDRVCLFGASYGGYATLWGLEKEPKMFRCGVAQVAVSDLELMFDVSWSDFMESERGGDTTYNLTVTIGDPSKDREKMRAVSPIYHTERIQAPVLLAYGASDRRVPLVHGKAMRSALEKYGKPYEWVVYDDEGHGFYKEENNFDFYRRVDAFLAKNLAPRAPPTATAAAATAQ
jgi:dipeptidyl aminopeptidase/acylaminoacyl peptidase